MIADYCDVTSLYVPVYGSRRRLCTQYAAAETARRHWNDCWRRSCK